MATIPIMSSASSPRVASAAAASIRHARPPRRVVFPTEEKVPEGKRHFELRTFLYQVLKLAFADQACIGCDQFVYWNARSPKRCLAPDVFVCPGRPDEMFDSWKTWERGTPRRSVGSARRAASGRARSRGPRGRGR